MNRPPSTDIGLTRWRDLAVVAVIAGVVAFGLLWWNYSRLPALPRLAGVPAALIGIGEAIFGWGLYRRIRTNIGPDRARGDRPGIGVAGQSGPDEIDPLTVARAVTIAKASALAAAAFGGLWSGTLCYVWPRSGDVAAAAGDRATALIGLLCAAMMLAGALWLERSCRTPPDSDSGPGPV